MQIHAMRQCGLAKSDAPHEHIIILVLALLLWLDSNQAPIFGFFFASYFCYGSLLMNFVNAVRIGRYRYVYRARYLMGILSKQQSTVFVNQFGVQRNFDTVMLFSSHLNTTHLPGDSLANLTCLLKHAVLVIGWKNWRSSGNKLILNRFIKTRDHFSNIVIFYSIVVFEMKTTTATGTN